MNNINTYFSDSEFIKVEDREVESNTCPAHRLIIGIHTHHRLIIGLHGLFDNVDLFTNTVGLFTKQNDVNFISAGLLLQGVYSLGINSLKLQLYLN